MRKLTLRHQWSGTGSGSCPAAYDVHDVGDYLGEAAGYRVEGVKLVDLAELAQLVDLGPDESAVFVAADSGQ